MADAALVRVFALVNSGVERPVVSVCRLTMKSGSDSFRANSAQDIMKRVKVKGVPTHVFGPTLAELGFLGSEVTHDPTLANCWPGELADVAEQIYTRDLFRRD